MFLPEERTVLDLPYQISPFPTNYGYYRPDCQEHIYQTQHQMSGPEAELTSLPVHVALQGRELWEKFSSIGTEMLITKSGRRMFPSCKLTVTGLNPKVKYVVIMDMVPYDNHKYKWNRDHWEVNGSGDPHLSNRYFIHPDSPATGEKWMQYPISFHKLKLTNKNINSNSMVILHSMHKYQPRLHIVQSPDPCYSYNNGGYLLFTFPEAAFIAVTAYQNQEITKLKIDNNPFAKGFRDNGLNRKRFREKEIKDTTGLLKEVHSSPNKLVGQSQKEEDGDVTVSSSVDCSNTLKSSDMNSNPFISAFIRTDTAAPSSHLYNHRNMSSPKEARPYSFPGTDASFPMVQSPCVQSSSVDQNVIRLPSHVSSPPQQGHFQSQGSQASETSQIHPIQARSPQFQPFFQTLPICPTTEPCLMLPPKVSRVQLPESALRNLEMIGPDHVSLRPLTDILNRVPVRGASVKVAQHLPSENFAWESEREIQIQGNYGQAFALSPLLTPPARLRAPMDRPSPRPQHDYCRNQNNGN